MSQDKALLAPRKRGRKPKTELERIRVKTWYWAVHARGWTDAELDVEFIPDREGLRHTKDTRVRNFERIRKKGLTPSAGSHPARNYDLIKKVEAHPVFKGTANYFYSPFWDLLNAFPQSLRDATRLVEECLALFGLRRITGLKSMYWYVLNKPPLPIHERKMGLREGNVSDFEFHLQQATSHLPADLNLIALFGALFREASLSFHPEEAWVLGQYFKISLLEVCEAEWIKEVGAELEDLARHRILYGEHDYCPSIKERNIGKQDIHDVPELASVGVIINPADPENEEKEKLVMKMLEVSRTKSV